MCLLLHGSRRRMPLNNGTVECPNGHRSPLGSNFCGECGERIGVERYAGQGGGESEPRLIVVDIELPGKQGVLRRTVIKPGAQPRASGAQQTTAGSRDEFRKDHSSQETDASANATSGTDGPDGHNRQAADESSSRQPLIASIVAAFGVMVGSAGPWFSILILTISGLDVPRVGMSALTLGALCAAASLTELYWARTHFDPKWRVPLAWAVVVAAVACLTFSLPLLVRIISIPTTDFFGVRIGPGVGWGLWLLVVSSAALCATASMNAVRTAPLIDAGESSTESATTWTVGWRRAAITSSAIIAVSGIAYYAVNWDDGSREREASVPALPGLPSFPSLQEAMDRSTSQVHTPAPTTTSSTESYRYALPGCYFITDHLTDRPVKFTFQTCADGSKRLEAMSWSSWGSAGAQGSGIFSYQVCEPNCAQGHRVRYAANVSAFDARPAGYNSGCPTDVLFYSEMIISFPASSPDADEVGTYTTYLGRPAIRFTTSREESGPDFLGNLVCY